MWWTPAHIARRWKYRQLFDRRIPGERSTTLADIQRSRISWAWCAPFAVSFYRSTDRLSLFGNQRNVRVDLPYYYADKTILQFPWTAPMLQLLFCSPDPLCANGLCCFFLRWSQYHILSLYGHLGCGLASVFHKNIKFSFAFRDNKNVSRTKNATLI